MGQNQNLLIVDDESALCWVLGQFFASAGYRVDSAQALDEALGLMTTGRYDLVISDLRLSGTQSEEGLMLADFVRRYAPDTRVVLLTAFATQEISDRARELGVDLVLPKPQPLPALAQHVSELLMASR
ncbi:response regulator [Pyxidicoccus xibeiensis]|uniref:response regulator n=1 Tax=Pyxidicoccus xibeiensis TaxID=2906759 RepID=UPI0020A72653|nr:response regulator [Pyxidicoccus xibeiensis]MCP3137692.1 response regulator [Pyxidicoccus xibeiensis]